MRRKRPRISGGHPIGEVGSGETRLPVLEALTHPLALNQESLEIDLSLFKVGVCAVCVLGRGRGFCLEHEGSGEVLGAPRPGPAKNQKAGQKPPGKPEDGRPNPSLRLRSLDTCCSVPRPASNSLDASRGATTSKFQRLPRSFRHMVPRQSANCCPRVRIACDGLGFLCAGVPGSWPGPASRFPGAALELLRVQQQLNATVSSPRSRCGG